MDEIDEWTEVGLLFDLNMRPLNYSFACEHRAVEPKKNRFHHAAIVLLICDERALKTRVSLWWRAI